MTTRHRSLIFPLLACSLSPLVGCGEQSEDFIEAQGTYPDGRPISFRERLQRVVCDATKADAPCVSLLALRLTAPAEELLRGVRINFVPSRMQPETGYVSSVVRTSDAPVTVYFVQARPDRFVDSSVSGGEIRFNSLAAGREQFTQGSFSDMVLRRRNADTGEEQTLMTLSAGSFRYYQP